jgi:WD40 repeat protein
VQVLSGTKRRVENLAFAPDGMRLAAGGSQGPVEVWDTRTGEQTHTINFAALMSHDAIKFHPDGTLFLGCVLGLRRCDLSTNVNEACAADQFPSHHLAVAPDGSFLLVSLDGTLGRIACGAGYPRAWEVPVHPLDFAIGGYCTGLAILAGGKRFVALDLCSRSPALNAHYPDLPGDTLNMSSVALRECATGKVLEDSPHPGAFAERPAVSPDGELLIVIGGRSLYTYRTAELAEPPLKMTNEVKRNFTGVAFHPSGEFIAAASNDATVRLIDTATWQEARAFTWELGKMRSVSFSPDGLRLAAGTEKGQVVIWDVDV